ncbi:uncharacterized protein LOC135397868 [Ornithodoros turicata]|uniref:uncharacterized protein LOC135397868 n=1 Tax=Ornithodoros turicata TaxID=34597 RepID=UPI00313A343A
MRSGTSDNKQGAERGRPRRRRYRSPSPRSRSPFPPTPAPRPRRSVTTWTVVHNGYPVSWASHSRWTYQHRPLRTSDPATVRPPFRGLTLSERHPADPLLPLSAEEQRLFCPTCGVPELHRTTHRQGRLHRSRAAQAPGNIIPEAAVSVLRRLRPEALRELLCAVNPPPEHAPVPPASPMDPADDLLMQFPSDEDV